MITWPPAAHARGGNDEMPPLKMNMKVYLSNAYPFL